VIERVDAWERDVDNADDAVGIVRLPTLTDDTKTLGYIRPE
jgi:hypothetical protein